MVRRKFTREEREKLNKRRPGLLVEIANRLSYNNDLMAIVRKKHYKKKEEE